MYLILPRKLLGIKDLMKLVTARTVTDFNRNATARTVDVLLPKFEMLAAILSSFITGIL